MITHINPYSIHLFVSPVFSKRSWVIEKVYPLTSKCDFFSAAYCYFFTQRVSFSFIRTSDSLSWVLGARIFFSSRWIFRSFRLSCVQHMSLATSYPVIMTFFLPSLLTVGLSWHFQAWIWFSSKFPWPSRRFFRTVTPHRSCCSYVSLLSLASFYFVCCISAPPSLCQRTTLPLTDCYKCFLVISDCPNVIIRFNATSMALVNVSSADAVFVRSEALLSMEHEPSYPNNISVVRHHNRNLISSWFLSVPHSSPAILLI